MNEKLNDHLEAELVGFVIDQPADLRQEITNRLQEIETMHNVEIRILSFEDWIDMQLADIDDKHALVLQWLQAFVEVLCQRRRDRAPIDEPADAWVAELRRQGQAWSEQLR